MIKNATVTGLKPEDVRDMIPRDTFLFFEGWQDAHNPPKPGANAPSLSEVREMARRYG